MNRWFPNVMSVNYGKNPNWLNSVWLGVTLPIIYFWTMLWITVVVPTIGYLITMVIQVGRLLHAIIFMVFGGLAGNLVVDSKER